MTEKQYAPSANEKKITKKTKVAIAKNLKEPKKTEEKKQENPIEEKTEINQEEKKPEKKITIPKIKKEFAIANGKSIPCSTKTCSAICKFIKYKTIQNAILDLEQVAKLKKAVPMKGEIPHRKGKMMSGRFPKEAAKEFILLLKGLQGNANVNEIEEPIIAEAFANIAQRPYGRFGLRKKRSHVTIIAKNKEKIKWKKEKQ